MPLWCNKHLPGQSASIIFAFEFFGMFVSTRTPSVFLGWSESGACLRNNIPFLRPSSCFLWSYDFDNQQHLVLNSLWLIVCHRRAGIFANKFRYFGSTIVMCRGVTTRLDAPGDISLAPPCSNLRSFGSKCTVLKKVLVTLLWLFPPAVIRETVPPCPPRYASGVMQ